MTKARMTQMFRRKGPMGMPGNSARSEKLAKMGRAEVGSRKKFQPAFVSARKVRKYRAT